MYESTRGTGFGAEVKRRIMLGTYVLSAGYYDAYYLKAQQVRTLIGSDYDAAFEQVDVIALPTSPTGAFRLGERTRSAADVLADVFTVAANLAGRAGDQVPCGFTDGAAAGRPAADGARWTRRRCCGRGGVSSTRPTGTSAAAAGSCMRSGAASGVRLPI